MYYLFRYSALAAVATTWIGGALLLKIAEPDVHEAISQYSVYGDTWVLFGGTLTVASLFLLFFGLYLRNYWPYAHKTTALAALFFITTAWFPYGDDPAPYWIHVVSFYLAVFCYAFTLWRCTIDFHLRLGHTLLAAVICSSIAAGIAVLSKQWSFHIELVLMVAAQVWTLLLAHLHYLRKILPVHIGEKLSTST